MIRYVCILLFGLVSAAMAGPTNSILFVTQVRVPGDFTTIASTFGNQLPTLDACGRGGDLYIRYPNGTLKNLTRAAGFGKWGSQNTNGIAVRQPCVHWSGQKAVFSMVIGAPTHQFDYSGNYFWQLYEITNFTDPNATPIITKVPNQPTNYNNIAPIYGSDDRIIFTSDRPRNGQPQLYPQLDEYEEAATVTGIWSLQPTNGNLFMVNHTPSGAFSPIIDSAGASFSIAGIICSAINRRTRISWKAPMSTAALTGAVKPATPSQPRTKQKFFRNPRSVRTDLLAGTYLAGNEFNQFFPWAIDQDGTDEETLNHIGRQEIGGSYAEESFTNDPNIEAFYYYGDNYNTNTVDNFLMVREDPNVPGLFYGIDAPEFATHSGGQIVSITGATNINAYYMKLNYLTPRSTHFYADSSNDIPSDFTGFYRNPMKTSDGYMIAAHTAYPFAETDGSDPNFPSTPYDFRLKFLVMSNGYYVPSTTLTSGLTNQATYWSPDTLVTATNVLWEFDPVEVIARARPLPYSVPLLQPELNAFEQAGVDVGEFQNYLVTHQLALIVSRDVTTRDHADHQQPFNLRVSGTTHETLGASGKIYDVAWLQLFQADQLRGLNFGDTNSPHAGRRDIAQYLHDPAVNNPTNVYAPTSGMQIAPDGSTAAFVPAARAVSWQLTDTNGTGVVRERYWLTFAAGEIRSCTSCHGINEMDQSGKPEPTNTPAALVRLLNYWKTNVSVTASSTIIQQTNYFEVTFTRQAAETGVTYHVQAASDLNTWSDIATYSGATINYTPQAKEVSRSGSPTETITVRDTSAITARPNRYLRIKVTRP